MKNWVYKFIVLSLLVATPVVALAQTLYVSDQLVITLREGKGNQYKIIRTLRTGTPMTVLSEEGNYVKVRTKAGDEGYVLKQYLTSETPKPIVIDQLNKEKKRLQGQLTSAEKARQELAEQKQGLQEELAALENTFQKSQADHKSLSENYRSLKDKSDKILEIDAERQRYKEQLRVVEAEAQKLRQENKDMMRTGMIKWFLAGGGVFFVGWIAGKISRKKKRSMF